VAAGGGGGEDAAESAGSLGVNGGISAAYPGRTEHFECRHPGELPPLRTPGKKKPADSGRNDRFAVGGELGMEIRRFEVTDAAALWRLRMTALETDPWSFAESVEELQQISVEEYGRRIGAGGDGNFVMGAFEDNAALGMCGFYRETLLKRRHKGHLWGVFTVPAARGKGLGRGLAQRAVETARSLPDLKSIQLTVSITQNAARQLYRSLGFRAFGVEPKGLGVGGEFVDEEHMILDLDVA
jgi:ribosomal protein S18 acetylase RimI-like enzyme